jgi:DNA-binding transcriptional regulator YiaG
MSPMPNIASILKAEISRVARKEVRGEIASLKKAIGAYRTEIAALKRRAQTAEKQLHHLRKASSKVAAPEVSDAATQTPRFSAKGLLSQRKRLGLSAENCGLLVGASGQSVYNWESGARLPRIKHLTAIAALKAMGKKDAAARLASIRELSQAA